MTNIGPFWYSLFIFVIIVYIHPNNLTGIFPLRGHEVKIWLQLWCTSPLVSVVGCSRQRKSRSFRGVFSFGPLQGPHVSRMISRLVGDAWWACLRSLYTRIHFDWGDFGPPIRFMIMFFFVVVCMLFVFRFESFKGVIRVGGKFFPCGFWY